MALDTLKTHNTTSLQSPAIALLSLLATAPSQASVNPIPDIHKHGFEQTQKQTYTLETAYTELSIYMKGLQHIQKSITEKNIDDTNKEMRTLATKIQKIHDTLFVYITLIQNAQNTNQSISTIDADMHKIRTMIDTLPHIPLLCKQLGIQCTE